MSLSTSEAATCRYSTMPGVAYSSMTNTFSTTGSFNHAQLITGLANGQSYNYYVRCVDQAGNANTNDYAISFSVSALGNFGRPASDVITGWSGTATPHWDKLDETVIDDSDSIRTGFAAGAETEEIKLSPVAVPPSRTGHILRVRAATENSANTLSYELRQGTTVIASTAHSLPRLSNKSTDNFTLTTAQANAITDYSDLRVRLTANTQSGRTHLYWIEFEVPAGSDTTPPSLSSGSPTGSLAAGTTQTTLSLSTDEAATCRYSATAGTAYSSMTNMFSATGGTSHSTLVTGLSDGNTYNYYVRCIDSSSNANTNDFTISFSVSTQQTCSDGTAQNTCSVNQPLLCDSNLNLVSSCTTCGCPSGRQCDTGTGSCIMAGSYNRLTFTGRIIRNNAAQTACSSCTLTIGLGGVTNTTTTATDGSFTLPLYVSAAPGSYLFDVTIDTGTQAFSFRKRGIVS
jgi:hypothetical protein